MASIETSSLLAAQAPALGQRTMRVFRPLCPADPEVGVVSHALGQDRRTSEHLGRAGNGGKGGPQHGTCNALALPNPISKHASDVQQPIFSCHVSSARWVFDPQLEAPQPLAVTLQHPAERGKM